MSPITRDTDNLVNQNMYTKVRSSLQTSQVTPEAGVYLGFNNMKQLGVFLYASPLQGYPRH